jgi:Uma2 family endonuclease
MAMALLQSMALEHPKQDEPLRIRPLRRVEFDRMVESGVFDEDEHIELLGGALVAMSPQGDRHSDCAGLMMTLLIRMLGDRASVRAHSPFAAGEYSQPEPDVALYPPRRYGHGHPSDALLVAEVSDSSLRKDRGIKSEIYAEAGVPEYWIVDLAHGTVEVRTSPLNGVYSRVVTHGRGDSIALVAFPDIVLATAEFLPPAE